MGAQAALVGPWVPRVVLATLVVTAGACRHRSQVLTLDADPVVTVKGVGFLGPENIVYDSVADVFLVSNIGGGGPARDNNGFISRVEPDGRVSALRWIAGGQHALDSPKGLAIRGDTLVIADIGVLRLFDRRTGAPLRTITLPGVVMNDVAFAPDGSIWITNTGPMRDSVPADTTGAMDAVWRVDAGGNVHAVERGRALDRPTGVVFDRGDALVATFGANRLERVGPGPTVTPATARVLPAGRLDGLRRMADGSLLITSWEAGVVWRLMPSGQLRRVLAGLTSPAGVAIDTRRHRLAVTSVQRNELYLLPLQ